MFAYISLLVDEKIFDTVDVFFLIVGHTHASIDQYFSVLARQIISCDFIGSPLSLHALLSREKYYNMSGSSWKHENKDGKQTPRKAKPLLIKKLSVIFDLKKRLTPMIDMSIKYYSIPHRFHFRSFMGVSIMQYSIYSTQKHLLPPLPEAILSGECSYNIVSQLFNYSYMTFM